MVGTVAPRRRPGLLVAGQVALSFVLLTSAGLLLGSFRNLTSRDHAGFRRDGMLLRPRRRLTDTSSSLPSPILERLRALPGVRAASFSLDDAVQQSRLERLPARRRLSSGQPERCALLVQRRQPGLLRHHRHAADRAGATLARAIVAGSAAGRADHRSACARQRLRIRRSDRAGSSARRKATTRATRSTVIGVVAGFEVRLDPRHRRAWSIYVPMAQASVSASATSRIELRGDVPPAR